MTTPLHSLIWKEWQERKWPVLLCCAYISLPTLIAWLNDPQFMGRDLLPYHLTCFAHILLLPLFLAMGTSAGERTQHTLMFSEALPVSLKSIGGARLAGAMLVVVLPLVCVTLIYTCFLGHHLLVAPSMEATVVSSQVVPLLKLLWRQFSYFVVIGIELLLLISLAGVRLRTETAVGFWGALITLGWSLVYQIPSRNWSRWWGVLFPQRFQIKFFETSLQNSVQVEWPAWFWLGNVCLLLALTYGFSTQYGRPPITFRTSAFRAAWARETNQRRRGITGFRAPWQALLWQNLRQSGPMAMSGGALCLLMTLGLYRLYLPMNAPRFGRELADVTFVIGMGWPALAAAALFAPELQAELETFWRSRPILPPLWFWMKFLTGLTATLCFLDGSVLVFYPRWSYAMCVLPLHLLLFSLGILGVGVTRSAVLGTVLSLGSFWCFIALTEQVEAFLGGSPIQLYTHLLMQELRREPLFAGPAFLHYLLLYGAMLVVCGMSLVLARKLLASPEGIGDRARRWLSRHLRRAAG